MNFLKIFDQIEINKLREKSVMLTSYLECLLRKLFLCKFKDLNINCKKN